MWLYVVIIINNIFFFSVVFLLVFLSIVCSVVVVGMVFPILDHFCSLFLGRKVKPFQSLIFLFWCVCRLFVWLPPPPPNIIKFI